MSFLQRQLGKQGSKRGGQMGRQGGGALTVYDLAMLERFKDVSSPNQYIKNDYLHSEMTALGCVRYVWFHIVYHVIRYVVSYDVTRSVN
jgi:hypothetical protein